MDITKWMDRFLNDVRVSELIKVQSVVCLQKELMARFVSVEICAHHRGDQPQVQARCGRRWKWWTWPAHQVHSQSGGYDVLSSFNGILLTTVPQPALETYTITNKLTSFCFVNLFHLLFNKMVILIFLLMSGSFNDTKRFSLFIALFWTLSDLSKTGLTALGSVRIHIYSRFQAEVQIWQAITGGVPFCCRRRSSICWRLPQR